LSYILITIFFSYNLSPQPFFSSPLTVNSFLNLLLSDELHLQPDPSAPSLSPPLQSPHITPWSPILFSFLILPSPLFFNKQVCRRRQQYRRQWQFQIENVAVALSILLEALIFTPTQVLRKSMSLVVNHLNMSCL